MSKAKAKPVTLERPTEGGRYTRNPDGTLTRVVDQPQPEPQPAGPTDPEE